MACSEKELEKFNNLAKDEIGESTANLEEAVQQLKDLVQERYPNLQLPPDQKECENFLQICLRVRKFNLENAAEQVHKFFQFMKNMNAAETFVPSLYLEDVYETYGLCVLKERDFKGRQTIYWDFEKCPSDTFDLDRILPATMLLWFEMLRTSKETQRIGINYLCNLKSYDFTHMRKIFMRIRAALRMVIGCFPMRIKGIHVVSANAAFKRAYDIVKPFFGKKIGARVHLYGADLYEMFKEITPTILPESAGGRWQVEECADVEFARNLAKKDDFYKEFFKWGYTDSVDHPEDSTYEDIPESLDFKVNKKGVIIQEE